MPDFRIFSANYLSSAREKKLPEFGDQHYFYEY